MNIGDVKGIGPKLNKELNKIGVYEDTDLLVHYPFRYNVLKKSDISALNQDDYMITDGVVENIAYVVHLGKRMDKMSFKLNTGELIINVVIFNRGFYKSKLGIGTTITVMGKYDLRHNTVVASELRFEALPINPVIEPIYHTTYGLSSKLLNSIVVNRLKSDFSVVDYIPDYLCEKYSFISKKESTYIVHCPSSIEVLRKARNRLKYEELFLFMLKMNSLKGNKHNKIGLKRDVDYSKVEEFIGSLPFKLTNDQLSSIKDIYDDLMSPIRMNRLLQGDVGSGKTIVSVVAIFINYLSGYQSALMAPTDILANQHFSNISSLFGKYGIRCELLTGKLKVREKKEIYKRLEEGDIDVVIGTHALFSDSVKYHNLGLVITDEQHRFGVNQRGNLKNKGITPDILYMSATPIPRTYALTIYGDMDVSSIKTRPGGRKDIITCIKKPSEIRGVLDMMNHELESGHQVYVIAPLIEESDTLSLENVNKVADNMNKAFGKKYNIGVLHGKLDGKAKEDIMNDFKDNKIQILISTTVIEVGIDVGNATMMVIYDAYRFGLSALHQLRGRVGRNELQSYCVLISNREAERLNVLVSTNDGFKVSEEDFKLRGSGDLFGYKQSGDMSFNLADFKKDFGLLMKAKDDSQEFLDRYSKDDRYKYIMDLIDESNNLD